jgi:hypothetical protein
MFGSRIQKSGAKKITRTTLARKLVLFFATVLISIVPFAQTPPPSTHIDTPRFLAATPYRPALHANEPREHNIRHGNVTGRLEGSVQTEFNSNVDLSENDGRNDISVGPFVSAGLFWPVNENNTLEFDLGLGYRAYFDNPELSSFFISPDSRLNYQTRVGDVRINVHDRFALEADPLSRPEFSGMGEVLEYRRFHNDAGLTIFWEPVRDITLLGGYNYVIDRSLGDDFPELDRDDHVFHAAGYHAIGSRAHAGLRASYTATRYNRPIQNDGDTFSVGPHVIAQLGDFVTADAGLNYTSADFDRTGTIQDDNDFDGLTYFAGLHHRMNSRTTHYVRAEKAVNPGFRSNFTDMFSLQYGISVRASSALTVRSAFVFEHFVSSAEAREDANRYLWFLGSNIRFARAWAAGLGYSLGMKESNLPARDYTQHRVTLEVTHHF